MGLVIMIIEMEYYEIVSYIEHCLGYDVNEAECLADFFYNRGWDNINIRKYIANSNIYIIPYGENVDEYIKKGDSEDYILMKADNGYTYLEFY